MSLAGLWIVFGLNVYAFASLDTEEQFTTEFEKVLQQEEVTQENIDDLIDILDKSILSDTEDAIDESIFPKEPVVNIEEEGSIKKDVFDIDRLSYAISMAETAWYTKGYWVTHNNGHGIKYWNTAPCTWVPKMAMCKFNSRLESHEAFKKIWLTHYKTFPTYRMADRWTGWDNTGDWLRIVTWAYQTWPKK